MNTETTPYHWTLESTPRTANGQRMNSIGKMCVQFQGRCVILSRVIISWKTVMALGILPQHYPIPPPTLELHMIKIPQIHTAQLC